MLVLTQIIIVIVIIIVGVGVGVEAVLAILISFWISQILLQLEDLFFICVPLPIISIVLITSINAISKPPQLFYLKITKTSRLLVSLRFSSSRSSSSNSLLLFSSSSFYFSSIFFLNSSSYYFFDFFTIN